MLRSLATALLLIVLALVAGLAQEQPAEPTEPAEPVQQEPAPEGSAPPLVFETQPQMIIDPETGMLIPATGNPYLAADDAPPPVPPRRPDFSVPSFGFSEGAPVVDISPEDEALIRAISAHHSAIESMVGRFVQIDQAGGRLEGAFYLHRPNKVRFRYDPPAFTEILSTGRGFYVIDTRERTRSVYPQDQVPLRQFLTDRIDLLNANITNVTRTEEMLSVSLTDETPIGAVEVTLVFEIASRDLRQWALTEPSGSTLTFSLHDTITAVNIPDRYFAIDPNLLDADRAN